MWALTQRDPGHRALFCTIRQARNLDHGRTPHWRTPLCLAKSVRHRACCCRAATLEDLQVATEKYVWPGHDEYDVLEDRRDAPPLSLPPVKAPRRIVLVRHGQSTWNAEGRVQGSCNLSVLTEKGKSQAHTTKELVGRRDLRLCQVIRPAIA